MTCHELYGRLTDYTEGVLDASARAAVEEHVTGCFTCAALLGDLTLLSRLCREEAPALMPKGVRGRIEELLAGGPADPPATRRRG